MSLRRLGTALLLTVAVPLLLAAGGCRSGRDSSHILTVTGSTTILPIAEIAGEMFAEEHPGDRVLVSGVGSSAGIESVAGGSSDIGTSSRDLKPEEASLGLVDTPIAYDAIAVIVNESNPVDALTMEQVRSIFEGRVRNWREVGGPDMPIGLVNRDEASGTREAFFKIALKEQPFDPAAAVLPGTGQVRAVVAGSKGAVGYISYGFVDETVKAVSIDGVVPSPETVADKRYPISRMLHMLTKGEPIGIAKEFIDFLLAQPVQDGVIPKAGFIPIRGASS
ncbi:MAG: phosphate ABC transporter substrate-binding protein [Coriobacteriia bacterium]